jgi:hypothetical protein
MLEKFITKSEVCITSGHPTPLGYLVLIGILIIALIGWSVMKR